MAVIFFAGFFVDFLVPIFLLIFPELFISFFLLTVGDFFFFFVGGGDVSFRMDSLHEESFSLSSLDDDDEASSLLLLSFGLCRMLAMLNSVSSSVWFILMVLPPPTLPPPLLTQKGSISFHSSSWLWLITARLYTTAVYAVLIERFSEDTVRCSVRNQQKNVKEKEKPNLTHIRHIHLKKIERESHTYTSIFVSGVLFCPFTISSSSSLFVGIYVYTPSSCVVCVCNCSALVVKKRCSGNQLEENRKRMGVCACMIVGPRKIV